jgi:formate hydrogenlyase transcriptional activator
MKQNAVPPNVNKLVELHELLSVVKSGKELLEIIIEKIKPVFNFYNVGLFVLSEDGLTHSDWAAIYPEIDPSKHNFMNTSVSKDIIHKGSPIEYIINGITLAKQPLLYDFVNLARQFPEYPQLKNLTLPNNSLRDCLAYNLISQGVVLGFFCINSKQKNFFKPEQFEWFKTISNLIAIAVSHIQDNQKHEHNNSIKTRLLEITEDITNSNTGVELLKVIIEKVKPVFNFHDCGLFVLSDDGNMISDWAAINEDLDPSMWNDKIVEVSKNMIYKESALEFVIENIKKENSPIIFDFNDLVAKFPYHPQFHNINILEMGYRDCLVYNLKSEGKIIGCFAINALAKNFFKESQFEIFQSVANIIAIAVKNITEREKLIAEKNINKTLVSISENIASITNKKELFKRIFETLKPIIHIDDTAIIILSDDSTKWIDWSIVEAFLDTDATRKGNELGFVNYYPIDDVVKRATQEAGITTIDELLQSKQVFANYLKEADLKELIYAPLICQGKLLGSLFLESKQYGTYNEKQIPFLKSVANIIAIAVKNIITKERLIEEANIKSKLLEITEDITTSSSEVKLIESIIKTIKPMFNFHDCGLFVLSEDGTTHSDWAAIYDNVSPSKFNQEVAKVSKDIPHENTPMSYFIHKCVEANKPVLFDFVDLVAMFPEYPQIREVNNLEMGYRDCLLYNLKADGKIMGVFCINALSINFFKESQFNVFKAVTSIIAIAVKNVISKERINDKANIKILEIQLAQKIAETNGWTERLLEVNKLLQPAIPNNLLLVSFETKETHFPIYGFIRTGLNEYQKISEKDLASISKLDLDSFYNNWINTIKTYQQPVVLKTNALKEYNRNNLVNHSICQHFRFDANLIYPLSLEKYGKVMFSFFSSNENNFNDSHIKVIQNLESTLKLTFDRALAFEEIEELNTQLKQKNIYLTEEVNNIGNFDSIIGTSKVLKEVFKNVSLVANADTTVLVLGETGTGKELIARSLHNNSLRNDKSFIKVNCATLPTQLIESELFGHEKGSFTGALEKRIGKFELAHKGTIFLDEIGELPLELQAKLLRVIQEKEFERIGGKQTIQCNVRIIAATNRVLEKEVERGKFRADLFFRLNVFPINLPPLRERTEDIPLLATYFAQKFCTKMNKPFKGIDMHMLEVLQQYQWPGNIRELENVIEQAVIISKGIESLGLARQLFFSKPAETEITQRANVKPDKVKTFALVKEQKEALEKQVIVEALTKTNGRVRGKNGAAILLNILPTSLESKMKRYGIFKDEFSVLKLKL